MSSSTVPASANILIIGGGPSGSYTAAALSREGHQVALLESAKFPRYHVGESMLPSLRTYLRFIELEDQFFSHGFLEKPGATFKLDHTMDSTWTDFTALGPDFETFNVIRSEMDDMMLRHAEKQGTQVFEETRVNSIEFEGPPDSSRPIAAEWVNKLGLSGKITFDWLVDATGRSGLMSTKYLKNRQKRENLWNVASWGYWNNVRLHEGKKFGGAWFEALTDGTGWTWAIPLHNGTTSIGVVMHESHSIRKKKAFGGTVSDTEFYLDQFQFVPNLRKQLGSYDNLIPGSVKSGADGSYFAPRYSGDHFRIVGDAANFIDPFFSSGIHIALTGALAAAITICASIKGEAPEEIAQQWHDKKVGVGHTRFLFVVLAAYKQMRLQSTPVLTSDINATNFDEAFRVFQPVILGVADTAKLTDEKVNSMVHKFESHFDPRIASEHIATVRLRFGRDATRINGEILGPEAIETMADGDEDVKRVLNKFDALRVFKDDVELSRIGRNPLVGYAAVVERGKLGLAKV
ncbi:hypothetical protein D9757_007784 [Collybiopsis confluens]|uniref:Halogenase n=1 Tax=Collybiopsis confluens TaxID=2823264 RepID=A0A8H5HQ06_9AGAR|nr:hypothetical protein D9757_007784 [Collybiopsis confluens]